MTSFSQEDTWLLVNASASKDGQYFHFHAVENHAAWVNVQPELLTYFRKAHLDAKTRISELTNDSLHPADAACSSPYSKYPYALPSITLQGYFGEVIAGWFAESYSPSGLQDWKVPAHLFRYHLAAFHHLERLSQNGTAPSAIVGRMGDDCLAFRREPSGRITDILFCEAKCTVTHDPNLIAEAHEKASNDAITDILQLIEVLNKKIDTEAKSWVDSLRIAYFEMHQQSSSVARRCDLVCYVHGQAPKKKDKWICSETKHEKYTSNRTLNAVEMRLRDVSERIKSIYNAEVWK